jgi:hypothetical protein
MAKPKNITRNVQENCVVLRFQRQHQTWHETFSIKKYGGWAKAEAAAKVRREIVIKDLPDPIPQKGRMTKRNQSGVVGVHFAEKKHTKTNGKVYWYPQWYTKWPGCPRRGGVAWSVNQFGFDDAFVLAVLTREMEAIDRKKILAKFERVKKTKRYQSIVDSCALTYE